MEIIYRDYDNSVLMKVSQKEGSTYTPFDFTTATGIEIYFPGIDITLENEITVTGTTGVLELFLNDNQFPKGSHRFRLVVKDVLHPNGQILLHENVHAPRLRVM